MVEYTMNLDSVFGSLADATRRDILRRVSIAELSVNEIAKNYDLTLAAISKHLKTLEKAQLIIKQRRGKQQFVSVAPLAFQDASEYLKYYENIWQDQFDRLETLLKEEK